MLNFQTNADAQCTPMVTDPNVMLNVGAGSTAFLDSAAVAGHISGLDPGCVNYDFKDVNGISIPNPVMISCQASTGNQPGTYFLIIDDGVNFSQTLSFNVSVVDNTAPTFSLPTNAIINCQDNKDNLTLTGDVTDEMDNCGENLEATYTDNVTGLTGCNGTGNIIRTWTLNDGNGNSVSKDQTITVQDITAPTFVVPADVTIDICDGDINDLLQTGSPSMPADNCSMGLMPTFSDGPMVAGTCANEMIVTRTWSLIDACNNALQLDQTITLRDITAPTSTMMDVASNNAVGFCGANLTVQLTAANTSDNCVAFGMLAITNNFNAGGANASGFYPVGTTTVDFTITDPCMNSYTHSIDVVVTDTEAPTIAGCPADVTLNADNGECDNTFGWTAPTVTDNCPGTITESIFSDDPNVNIIQGTPGPGRTDLADFPVGITEVSYEFRDINGVADTCKFTVTVLDNQAPTILCPADQTITIGACNATNELMPDLRSLVLVTDNCPADYTISQNPAPNSLLSGIGGVTPANLEIFAVTFTVIDNNAGNGSDNCTINVTILDDSSLSLDTPGATLPTITSTCGPVTLCAPTATDECGNIIPGVPTPAVATIVGSCSAPPVVHPSIDLSPSFTLIDGSTSSFDFMVSGVGTNVVTAEIALEITHSWVGDLEVTLTSPSGTMVELMNRPGVPASTFGCLQDNLQVLFTDNASATAADLEVTCNPSLTGPLNPGPPYAINGSFQPIDPMSDFEGDLANGMWTLTFADFATPDPGILENLSLSLTTLSAAVVNEYEFPVGNHLITWNYDDGNGNLASQTQQIDIADDAMPPVLSCQDVTVELDENGTFSLPVGTLLGESISIAPGENGGFFGGSVEFCVTATADETISFSWDYSSDDISAIYDPFLYTVNGTETFLATSTSFATDIASLNQSGFTSVDLVNGDVFCFEVRTDNFFGSSEATVTNFSPSLTAGQFASSNWTEVINNAPGAAAYTSPVATDNCGVDFSTLAFNGGLTSLDLTCADVGNTFTFITLDDINGNTGFCGVNIFVEDNVAPLITGVPNDTTVTCGNVPAAGMPMVTDNCSTGLNAIPSEFSTKSGNPNTCTDYNYAIIRTWNSTDDQGNVATATQTITVEDNDAPSAPVYADNLGTGVVGSNPSSCNANISLALTGLTDCAPFANITVSNNSPFAFSTGADASGIYPIGTHNVNFTVTDPCGNTNSFNRVFTVVDDVSPIAICQSITLGLPSNGELILVPGFIDNGSTDNCGNIVSYSVSPDTFNCDHADGVTPWPVTLTVVDDSGNSASCNSTIIIQDNFAPTMSCQNVSVTLDVNGDASITVADVDNGSFDNCTPTNELVFSLSQTDFTELDFGSNTVTLTATDNNGNPASCTADVDVDIPETCFEVGTDADAAGSTVILPINISNFINAGSFQFLVTASDIAAVDLVDITPTAALGFGSFSTFMIGEDSIRVSYTVPQTPYVPLTLADGTTILEIEIFLAGNVGDFSFIEIISDPMSIPGELIQDFNGTFFQQSPLTCTTLGGVAINAPPNLFISGQVFTEAALPIAIAEVSAENSTQLSTDDVDTTGTDGFYVLGPVLGGDDYFVTPAKDTNWTNGVTAFDLGLIQQHVVGFDTLDTPYKKIAADAFQDNIITTFDILQLQIMLSSTVLGPGNLVTPSTQTSWVFMPAVDTPATLAPLFVPAYSQSAFLPALAMDTAGLDFIGVKIGDVTGNADPLTLISNDNGYIQASEGRSLGYKKLLADDQILNEGEEVTIPFNMEQATEFFALQWAFSFDTDKIEIVSAKANETSGLDDGDISLKYSDAGKVVFIAYNTSMTQVAEGAEMFDLTIRVKQSCKLSDVIAMDTRNLKANIYNQEGDANQVELGFNGALGQEIGDFALMQNQPNPFKDYTAIGFVLPEAGEATLTVTDVAGRVIKVIEGDYAAGYQQVELDRSDIPSNGVFFYTLESGDYQAVKQMTIVE